ncbi:hypothetical protein QTP70_006121 [Hemibagrus guttatus]|uniref:Uncharacterized protein n=1 Tax=Hemibagrus guttatus TaxID=175788 RepID=A0AAE0R483_9TELE|nr:hypothetical protein QTP70_006121 [Hemibagrus guttatus]
MAERNSSGLMMMMMMMEPSLPAEVREKLAELELELSEAISDLLLVIWSKFTSAALPYSTVPLPKCNHGMAMVSLNIMNVWIQNQTSEDYRERFGLLKGLLVLLFPPFKNCIHPE